MDTLRDWYRYLDEVSRPARRGDADEPQGADWRPWRAADEAAPAAVAAVPEPRRSAPRASEARETLEPEVVPPLLELPALSLGGRTGHFAEALQAPTPEFQDPTLYDELTPIPEFKVRPLEVPVFELTIPRFGAAAEVRPPLEIGTKGGAAVAEPEVALEPVAEAEEPPTSGAAARMDQYRELLRRFREEEDPGPARGRARESRDELLQRLLDPVLTLEETAVLLDVCPATVRRYTNKGQLKHFRTEGNQRRFRLWDVIEFRDSRDGRTNEAEAEGQAASEEDE